MREGGISERAIFVVDKRGRVVFAKVYDIPTLPDNAEVKQVIEGLGPRGAGESSIGGGQSGVGDAIDSETKGGEI